MIKKSTDTFACSPGNSLPPIKGNIQQLEQVIINLLSNSGQALSNREYGIVVSSQFDSPSNKVIIIVKDEGTGITPDNKKFIMDPFFTTKRDKGGTGLGLSISYKIIHDFQGDLVFNSEPGKGTEAKIVLPTC